MAHVLILPKQGNTVESCIVMNWKVKEGDQVAESAIVCEVETDKSTFEIPAGFNGTLLKILHEAGDDVPVLQPLAVIGQKGEDWKDAVRGETAAGPVKASATTASAPSHAIPSTESPVGTATTPGQRVSPRARNLAASEGVSVVGILGSGPGGRIIERDVRAALESRPAANIAPSSTRSLALSPSDAFTDTPIKGIRKLIADRMHESLASTAQFTLSSSASAVKLQELRARFKSGGGELGLAGVTINDLILFAVSRILPKFEYMNAQKLGDTLRTFKSVHLGLAVDTPKGLMVPVVRDADKLSLAQISTEAKRLAAACQTGSAKPDELAGSTFTVSNLGALGVESFTPVINIPEVAILGVAGIQPRVILDEDGSPSFVPHVGLSLTINHQVVDGAPAARFLKSLAEALKDLDLWLAL